ncbi:Fpg/Nei family DNA glycosylase [Microbacterium amylolyticum]|uniref:DNA-(apurinic or apyrimidinic site) lyase n=1 Tax=Microbacterium amylolyticum TaxID=936337 RepID=A0ABS4ZH03_9MICO|nr:Fpg/Nei family DNA glycosylase [Microbacterium amylolyticum]MBP2436557.1 endonuclease-8 [Microbacterium amylolyticum]
MPEGDTAHRTARRLHEVLAGDVVTRFQLRVPHAATADLAGHTAESVRAVGKHILHRIGEWTLHTHLRMEGQWHAYRPGDAWKRPAFQARAIVDTERWNTVGFDLGIVDLVPREREHEITDPLGPDPLSDTWDAGAARRRLTRDHRAAHVALLDQSNVAGFGNEYVNELLFLRAVDPQTPMSDVDIAPLLDLGVRAMRRNVLLPVRNFTGDARRGKDHWVYGRTGKPCRRCGTVIRETTLGARPETGRRVFWCPTCQP